MPGIVVEFLRRRGLFFSMLMIFPLCLHANRENSARFWIETLLSAIEQDGRGPTIHARNLFHVSAAMYDAWAIYDKSARPWLLGQSRDGFDCPCNKDFSQTTGNIDSLRQVAMSYAVYRLLTVRFDNFSGKVRTLDIIDEAFKKTGLAKSIVSRAYQEGSAAELGNYIADCYLNYGYEDGANEVDDYENFWYEPQNPRMKPDKPGVGSLFDVNRWQPLYMFDYIDRRGGDNTLPGSNLLIAAQEQIALSPEWGNVRPFAMGAKHMRHGIAGTGEYKLWLDPGPPPKLTDEIGFPGPGTYKWGFLLVGLWSAHLDPADSVYWDISPGALGHPEYLPTEFSEYGEFYNLREGGVLQSGGHDRNPVTGKPYVPNRVLRGDYTRVIAEYWADALNTSGPPGHWFRILNRVTDHPEFRWKWRGKGKRLDMLEWYVKAYFTLGSGMHDAAIACWSAKGYYDYVRPITAIRLLAGFGQCSDPAQPAYDPRGLPLMTGRVELVGHGDPLAGEDGEHVGKVKIFAWRGPDAIEDFTADVAGVGWILGENWWPYQRYSSPTPNFPGYVSGHSTFSSAAAEILTQITGNRFFPGGLFETTIKKGEFLMFERGPSADVTLQWATYQDAAAETCLSRIWGGIHPPADDLPGRRMGQEVGKLVVPFAERFFN